MPHGALAVALKGDKTSTAIVGARVDHGEMAWRPETVAFGADASSVERTRPSRTVEVRVSTARTASVTSPHAVMHETPRPIFLLSLPRSGSTLVQRVLAAHPQIATAPEPWILLPLAYAIRERGIAAEYTQPIAARAIREFVEGLPSGEDEYWHALGEFVVHLYAEASEEGATYFLDKTPRYHYIVSELFRMFPDSKFIFLWRDPLAIVASIVETWARGRWNIDRWQGDLRGISDLVSAFEQHRDGVLAVRYESLVSEPDRSWSSLFGYLDLPFDPGLLRSFSDVRLEGKMGDPTGVHTYDTISTEPLEKWRRTLANPWRKRWCREYLTWIGQQRLSTMGYDLDELLRRLEEIPSSPRMMMSDAVRGGYWAWAQRRKRAAFRKMAPRAR